MKPYALPLYAVLLAACSTSPAPKGAALPEPLVLQAAPDLAVEAAAAAPVSEPAAAQDLAVNAAAPSRTAAKSLLVKPSSAVAQGYAAELYAPPPAPADSETYASVTRNPVLRAAEQPLSTFSIDVDTGSYANVRRFLNEGRLPPSDAVRVEEMLNYFRYDYAAPRSASQPFAVHTELAPTPWNAHTRLLRIGIKGFEPQGELPPSNLVFLVDVSGSMDEPNKLPLVQKSLKLLAGKLSARDRISLVTYAGSTRLVLPATAGNQRATIEQAIDQLSAGGGTNGESGIQLAYQQAQAAFIKGGNNRVLLATDGDFNVGITRFETLLDLVKEKRKTGVALTTLGFGTGNYNDRLMEQVADAGDGNYAYIDTLSEAAKVLVEQRNATLLTIAQDVKIQVEFNPGVVAEYRLIGYENRALKREDFANDAVDAGEIGAGHTVTALYEVALVGEGGERNAPLRYGTAAPLSAVGKELAFVRLRYKQPGQAQSQLIQQPVLTASAAPTLASASPQLRLAAGVAAFGQRLSGSPFMQGFDYPQISSLVRSALSVDGGADSGELLKLLSLAQGLSAHADSPVVGMAVAE